MTGTRCAHCHQPIRGLRWLIPSNDRRDVFLCDRCYSHHNPSRKENPQWLGFTLTTN
jgi:hypothetical protein